MVKPGASFFNAGYLMTPTLLGLELEMMETVTA